MRRTSVSLPTKLVAQDPHEKPDRYKFIPKKMKDSVMTQAQKSRWIKTATIVLVLVTLFYFMSPRGVEIYKEGTVY